MHAGQVAAFQFQTAAGGGTGGQHDGLVAAALQFGQADVRALAHTGIAAETHADLFKTADLGGHHVIGQTVGGDAVTQHAAGERTGFEDRDRIAHEGQEPGAGKTGRTGTHHGHLADVTAHGLFQRHLRGPVAEHMLHGIDIDSAVHTGTGACGFTGMEADTAGDGRERLDSQIIARGFVQVALLDQIMVAANIHTRRTGRHAGISAPVLSQGEIRQAGRFSCSCRNRYRLRDRYFES